MIEHYFSCPHCFQEISISIDGSIKKQQYVEDCEICCNPLLITIEVEGDKIIYFRASPAQ